MIISVIDGGLGNQMFQYAFLKALSKHYQCSDICVDIVSYDNNDGRSYLLDRFNISETIIYSKNNKHNKAFYRLKRFLVKKIHRGISKRVFIEVKMFSYDARVFENRAVRYEGFWQSYKYFNKI